MCDLCFRASTTDRKGMQTGILYQHYPGLEFKPDLKQSFNSNGTKRVETGQEPRNGSGSLYWHVDGTDCGKIEHLNHSSHWPRPPQLHKSTLHRKIELRAIITIVRHLKMRSPSFLQRIASPSQTSTVQRSDPPPCTLLALQITRTDIPQLV